jgi:hypothetical protein
MRLRLERLAAIYEARAVGHDKRNQPHLAVYDRQVAADIREALAALTA